MYKLRINPIAKRDLIDIKEYITNELDNPTVAVKVVSRIIESYEKLKEFPMLGGDLSLKVDVSTNYRYLISGNYIVFYKVDDIYISIYRILYARRDYTKILFRDEKFEIEPE
ncbi:type II toxin-antitoxin system RelE/ParE family toxin [Clostridium sp. DL1XJH146]